MADFDFAAYLQEQVSAQFHHRVNLVVRSILPSVALCYMPEHVDLQQLHTSIIIPLQQLDETPSREELNSLLPVGELIDITSVLDCIPLIVKGWVYIATPQAGIAANVANLPKRPLTSPENETTILGPMLAFTESIGTNTALLRNSIPDTNLCSEEYKIGNKRNTTVNLMFMADRVSQDRVELVRQRIKRLRLNDVTGSSEFLHMIQDNDLSVFPQLMLTERIDLASHSLLEGKIIILLDGSPLVIVGPSEFIDFFLSMEDRYLGWGIGTFIRVLRMVALIISVFLTPAYVAALTFHYEMIPSSLLVSLIESRSRVPFPPLFETLILEVTMELLREAGARLPTKVGQTMGIVGGIVIGQAAVQAGFTSNILIMLVALAALGSFATPDYLMSSSLRLVRYPMVLFAGIWGSIGIVFVTALVAMHLIRQTSFGRPFFSPVHPIKHSDLAYDEVLLPEPDSLTPNGQKLRKFIRSISIRSLWTGKIDN
ncbi:spore germination protein [Paenibacillus alvei]|uniref:spore germination protein n=1 Tax=Paenibacillus alvei TaxID=44250 RepID=UPI0018CE1CA1|nr:spore germination protein [Paenibacillus alvei]MBG9737595.1 spore gernimation protein GerI [Paenibacillus alvei]MBG9747287.1 spore gernimation protein GerI [Paenibacillus alvei]MCY9581227.1 spore germination protein [Paenibacillus alvei]MCY9584484.1 spore germination protein [Paenibacillus alvei]